MRVRREAARAGRGSDELLAVVGEVFGPEPTLEEGSGVDTRRGVRLEEDEIAERAVIVAARTKEMVEADLEQVGGRCVARDVAAELGGAAALDTVGAHHHRQRVPAHQRGEPLLHREVAREGRLRFECDRVDVRRDQRRLPVQAAPARVREQGVEQEAGTFGTVRPGQRVERLAPLGGLGRIDVGAASAEEGGNVGGKREIGHAEILTRAWRGLTRDRRRSASAARRRAASARSARPRRRPVRR